ncbi:MAG: hypothetical protein WCO92_04120 [Verrucomicrobiota bacterium]
MQLARAREARPFWGCLRQSIRLLPRRTYVLLRRGAALRRCLRHRVLDRRSSMLAYSVRRRSLLLIRISEFLRQFPSLLSSSL